LGDEGLQHLCELLWENYYITEIDLSENYAISSDGVLQLCGVLAQTGTLKRVSLKGNHLDDKSATFLSEMLKQNTSLRYLDISYNDFAEESGLHFGPAISENEYLVELNLSWTNLRRKGALSVAKSLVNNITLKKLDLSWNGFGDDGAYVLSDALRQNGSLEQLDISSNRLTHVAALHLQKALKDNEGLLVLKVGKNPLQHGTEFILQGIKENPQSTLQELDLTDVQVNNTFVETLHLIHGVNPGLVVYHGGFGGASCKPAPRPKPMKVLRDHIKKNRLRIFDVFSGLDKDKSMRISVKELAEGLSTSGVPLRYDELFELVRTLDLNGDGEVDYKELVIGNKEMEKEDRVELKKTKAKEERNKNLAKDLRPSTPSQPLPPPTINNKSPRNSRPGTGTGSRKGSLVAGGIGSPRTGRKSPLVGYSNQSEGIRRVSMGGVSPTSVVVGGGGRPRSEAGGGSSNSRPVSAAQSVDSKPSSASIKNPDDAASPSSSMQLGNDATNTQRPHTGNSVRFSDDTRGGEGGINGGSDSGI